MGARVPRRWERRHLGNGVEGLNGRVIDLPRSARDLDRGESKPPKSSGRLPRVKVLSCRPAKLQAEAAHRSSAAHAPLHALYLNRTRSMWTGASAGHTCMTRAAPHRPSPCCQSYTDFILHCMACLLRRP